MEPTITITPQSQRLQLAASQDVGRYNMSGVYYDERCAVATNGHILALRKKDEEEPTNTQIQFAKAKRTNAQRLSILEQLRDSEHYASRDGVQAQAVGSEFPNYMVVVKDAVLATNTHTLHLDVKLLTQLAEALGAEGKKYPVSIQINLDKPTAPLVVRVQEERDAVGIIMPMRGEGSVATPIDVLKSVTNFTE